MYFIRVLKYQIYSPIHITLAILSPFKNSKNKNGEHLMNIIKLCISYKFQNIEYAHLYTSHYQYYHHLKTAQIKTETNSTAAQNELSDNSK
jgi:hypothetical protein